MKKHEKFLGFCLFAYSNESWKGPANGENNYGLILENGDKKNGYHAVEQFKSGNAYRYINEFRKL